MYNMLPLNAGIPPSTLQGLQDARFTLTARAAQLSDAERPAAREAFLKKYPDAFWVDFGDFRWFKLEPAAGGRYVGGFGNVRKVRLAAVAECNSATMPLTVQH